MKTSKLGKYILLCCNFDVSSRLQQTARPRCAGIRTGTQSGPIPSRHPTWWSNGNDDGAFLACCPSQMLFPLHFTSFHVVAVFVPDWMLTALRQPTLRTSSEWSCGSATAFQTFTSFSNVDHLTFNTSRIWNLLLDIRASGSPFTGTFFQYFQAPLVSAPPPYTFQQPLEHTWL